jgi:hypothetical protein
VFLPPGCPWSWLEPAQVNSCEDLVCGWVVQPANTWSNIAYLIVAYLIARTPHKRSAFLNFVFVYGSLVLFVGSTFFHASGSMLGKMADFGAMFIISLGLLVHALQRWLRISILVSALLFFSGLIGSLTVLWVNRHASKLFAAQVILLVALEIWLLRKKEFALNVRNLLTSVVIISVAYLFWLLDVKKILCWPENHIFTAHSAWHFLAAAAIYFAYLAHQAKEKV